MKEDSKKSKNQEKWLKSKWFEIVGSFKNKNKGKDTLSLLEHAVKSFEKVLESETIPSAVTLSPEDDPEQKIIALNFRSGCLNNTEVTDIQKEVAKSLVHKFFEINTTTKSTAQQSGLIRDKVPNENEYAFLYAGLYPDIDILEIQYCGTGRIFGFFTQATFNVVCVRTKHIENH